jgi:hypothetical protein
MGDGCDDSAAAPKDPKRQRVAGAPTTDASSACATVSASLGFNLNPRTVLVLGTGCGDPRI